MANENETVLDIVAEMRINAKAGVKEVCADYYAGRLEAARKRESQMKYTTDGLVCMHDSALGSFYRPGNAEAMRVALERIYRIASTAHNDFDVFAGIERVHKIAIHALAAPPRNCDRFKTAEEALKAHEAAFDEDNLKNGECKLGCPDCDNPRIGCKIAWLFAPAAERKGEGDGR